MENKQKETISEVIPAEVQLKPKHDKVEIESKLKQVQKETHDDSVLSRKELKRLKLEQLKKKLKKKRVRAALLQSDDGGSDQMNGNDNVLEEAAVNDNDDELQEEEVKNGNVEQEEDNDETDDNEEEDSEIAVKIKKLKTKLNNEDEAVDTEQEVTKISKLNASFPNKTVSIAVPASIILNAQTPDLKAYLIGQIARTAAIFNCYEIIVYDEYCTGGNYEDDECEEPQVECVRQMSRVLRYLECPQYLRKSLFPLHKDFKFAGVMNPLDAKHHLRFEDDCEFREGVVNANKNDKSFVYVGLKKEALVNQVIEPGTRVTVRLDIFEEKNYLNGKVVSPNLPKEHLGTYWGYEVRVADSLASVLRQSPFGMPYDLTIGTSDRGDPIDSSLELIPEYRHALIVFGGLKGIESALETDESLNKTVKDARELFNYYLNTCPKQGTNTIRTEEAMLISLASLRTKLFT